MRWCTDGDEVVTATACRVALPPLTLLLTTPVIVRRYQMLSLLRVNWTQMS